VKFSIVTPSFNQGAFIADTLESVLSQEGDFSIEYFIFDGGSTDETVDILKSYNKLLADGAYPIRCNNVQFFWISEKDRGQSHAINKGLERSTGDVVTFLSSDDQYELGTFEVVAKFFLEHPQIDMVHGDGYFLHQNTGIRTLQKSRNISLEEMTTTLSRIIDPSVFYRKQLIARIGLLDESLHFVMFYDFLIRALMQGTAQHIAKPFITFRLWEQSKTVTQKDKFIHELDSVHKKHGLSVLNVKRIQNITSRPPFTYLRTRFPQTYAFFKRMFYRVFKNITYTRRDNRL